MTSSLELATPSADATKDLAAAIAGWCLPGDVLLLSGDLGAGKTTFAQGFGRALGIDEPVTSPTFTLVRQYELAEAPRGIRVMLHADVYRLEHLAEVADLGLGQLVEEAGVALVEWGEAAEPVLGDGALSVRLEVDPDDDDRRAVAVSSSGAVWEARWADLVTSLERWTTAGPAETTGGGSR
jgi:tRNA threonylcarbamoyladenosine biosynthesis protein TsaE